MDFLRYSLKKTSQNTRKNFKKLQCHPKNFTSKNSMKNYSCLDVKALKLMKQLWNRRYPDNMVHTSKPKEIWRT